MSEGKKIIISFFDSFLSRVTLRLSGYHCSVLVGIVIIFCLFLNQVTMQDLADTYQPPFKSCVEQGRASGIMCAYNKVNGVPSCADSNLLSKTVRAQWGFRGYVLKQFIHLQCIFL